MFIRDMSATVKLRKSVTTRIDEIQERLERQKARAVAAAKRRKEKKRKG
jgi:hypothetical protein